VEHQPDPILQSLAENAANVCGAYDALMMLADDKVLRVVAHYGPVPSRVAEVPLNGENPAGSALLQGRVIPIEDALTSEFPLVQNRAQQDGIRSSLTAPLFSEAQVIGAVMIRRLEPGPFTDRQIELLQTFANLAVIAIQNRRLLAEVETKNQELAAALERETATSEVLRVISQSPTDLQPALNAIAEKAARVCGVAEAGIRLLEGDRLPMVAYYGSMPVPTRDLPLTGSMAERALQSRQPVYIRDLAADEVETWVGRLRALSVGTRTMLLVPLVREGQGIGVIFVRDAEPAAFSDKQVQLLQNFADQAVIAIENARLFEELQAKNRELTDALEQQTATAEVLKVIASSPTELQPVLDTIAERAAVVCGAEDASIRLLEGMVLRGAAHFGPLFEPPAEVTVEPGMQSGRAILEGRTIHVPDVLAAAEEFPTSTALSRISGTRTGLAVPLQREGRPIGAIVIRRTEKRPFSDSQIALLETFADQAVIAIENVRLFTELNERNTELREALNQQAALAEILRIVGSSPTDLQPVLDAIVAKAVEVCHASDATVRLIHGDSLRLVAHHGDLPRGPEDISWREGMNVGGGAVRARRSVYVRDLLGPEGQAYPGTAAAAPDRGMRSLLSVPLLLGSGDAPLGSMNFRHREPDGFTPQHIALLEAFASQAVIAIENARLFNELRQALEQQTATSEVLRIISSAPPDLDAALNAIAQNAARLCSATDANISMVDGDSLVVVARYGTRQPEFERFEMNPRLLGPRAVLERRIVHEADVLTEVYTEADEPLRQMRLRIGTRALLNVPLRRDDEVLGVIQVRRAEPGLFSDQQVQLLEVFADQAVIAIENARLFKELGAKNAELEVASKHKSDFLANMSHELRTPLNAIISFSEILQEDASDNGDEAYIPDLQEINAAGKHLLGLINDILDLSKIEAGRMDLYVERFDLGTLLREVCAQAQRLVEKNGNVFVFHAPEALGEMESDQTRVRQCLLNLLSNAAKFTEQGTVTLEATRQQTDGRETVRFTVTDTGIGITEEQVGRLFQAFSQADVSTSRRFGGTGLGLAITKQFCEMMGGDVTVKSEAGKGSSFSIVLPVDPRTMRAHA
jgi:GAF domain-containing protein